MFLRKGHIYYLDIDSMKKVINYNSERETMREAWNIWSHKERRTLRKVGNKKKKAQFIWGFIKKLSISCIKLATK